MRAVASLRICQAAASVLDCFKLLVAAELEMLEVNCRVDM